MLPLVAVLLAGAGAAPLRAASPALRAAARRDVAAFLDGQPAGASVEALVAAFAARRAAREPDRAAGVHALKRALLKRRLFDVHAMADAADASVLDGACACPLTSDECAETTVYNNTLLHRPSDGSPMELYYRETQPLDAMLAGDANCQELQGFEVCDDTPDCVPSTASLIYDCDAAAATMLGVAQVRSAELDNDDAEVYAALADRTGGTVTGDDDMFYGLTSQTVYVYTLLELQGQVTCSDGCNFYDACKTSCGGLAAEGADQSLDLDTSCTGVLAYVTPAPTAPPSTAAPSTAAPSLLPAPAPTLAPLPAPTAPPAPAPTAPPAPAPTSTAAPTTSTPSAAPTTATPTTATAAPTTAAPTTATDAPTAGFPTPRPTWGERRPTPAPRRPTPAPTVAPAPRPTWGTRRPTRQPTRQPTDPPFPFPFPPVFPPDFDDDGAGGGNGGGRGSRTDDGAGGVAPAPTPAPTPATITTSSSKKDDDDTDAASGGILALIIIAVLLVLLALLYYLKKRRDEAAAETEAPPELEAPPPPVAVDDVEADAGAIVVASEPPADALVPATDAPAASTAIKTKINEAEL